MAEPALPEANFQPETEDVEGVSWHATEFEYHHKKFGWYFIFVLIFASLVAVAYFTKQWLTIGVFGVMAIALMVYANRRPRELTYSVDSGGVSIEGKHFPHEQFQSFAVISSPEWRGIDLDPVKRFMPRVSLPLEEQNAEKVIDALTGYLPRLDREPDLMERLTRRLKF